jgi:RNA polymerase sigma factor (TIGR02999 family)
MPDVTLLLEAAARGDPKAADELLPLVYNELRELAAARMAAERADHTLQPTALVHEAYIRLVGGNGANGWNGRGHFFAAAAEAMRRILVEAARRKRTAKQGGDCQRIDLDHFDLPAPEPNIDLIALDEALADLERHEPQAAKLVKLRFFAGWGHQEAAELLGISRGAADRLWALARAWLFRRVRSAD